MITERLNVSEMPTGQHRVRFNTEAGPVEVTIDWRQIRMLAQRAMLRNKSRRATSGPVSIRGVS